jgi:hypothetical protein
MNIEANKGTQVIYNGTGGYDADLKHANKYLTIGTTYTVEHTVIHNFNTDVYLEEFPKDRICFKLIKRG